ncbi:MULTISPECIES: helix-turn-helix domain-containing protein [Chryseobacterium]|uniref:AraC family transcriptional activator of pobA n=1 Tax=Chryseobacterium camelliae TaxID=1265445 RepID=A0ABU0THD7_9FLAO|nr:MULTISPECIES: AraC family transcriptional regulator [Chryseobacterium]MDT3405718.1 AraC family transcriptional activator of pobA [Pseudacidovorax intermedius]MDQ1096472.1 AraC family transcriptional activator of pobA [Chryseobacterium camelliae]MDQ1100412.1 AraC family transcriptional activator of pobA [Chryseobacterium sp. SORGH_AS_1048]MDR6087753.1 AraC family transcriptional activator of pobA [Chryseobacterium sp. SORGH_AS_0909]MDR6132129.1 AraC family transcriptional activator of pobA [
MEKTVHTSHTSLEDFYREMTLKLGKDVNSLFPKGLHKEIGHFNVFDIAQTIRQVKLTSEMPYNRRKYYKISLIRGKNRAEYADKVIRIEKNALLFATPKVPYHWIPEDPAQTGSFCVFTEDFMVKDRPRNILEDLPIFRPGAVPLFEIDDELADEIELLYAKIKKEIDSDYAFKYDLIRNYVAELIHYGQKLQPAEELPATHDASLRVVSMFLELLERQFPIESTDRRLQLKTAKDYADRLAVHVNYLNKRLKESTGKTTTEIIAERVVQEAKILLRQTRWNVSEIAYALGFEEIAHFSNFFKKKTALTPVEFRA